MNTDDPSRHYDNVTQAWEYLLGDNLHYGYYEPAGIDLASATTELNRQMASAGRLADCNGGTVLDVGCGTGGPACWIVSEFDVSVTGISTSAVGIERANQRAAKMHLLDKAAFRLGDAQDNGLKQNVFDRVWVMESSHLMPDKPAMLSEAARVLKPGGRLVLCDIIAIEELPLSAVLKNAKAFDNLRKVYGRAKMETLEFYRTEFERHRLEVDVERNISSQTRQTFDHWRENAMTHKDEVVPLIGSQAWQDFVDSCDILARFWDDRVLGYGLISGYLPE